MAGTGKEYSIVILSSSPPAHDVYAPASPHATSTRRVAMLPSSPINLSPPLSPLKTTYGALASGSRAAPIPETAVRGFATVGNLVRSEHFADLDDGYTESLPEKSRKSSVEDIEEVSVVAKQPRKRATKKATAADGEKPPPKPRTRKSKADTDAAALDAEKRPVRATKSPYFADADTIPEPQDAPAEDAPKLTKAGKPRKPRAKKEKVEGDVEAKPKRTRVVEPKAAKPTKTTLQEDVAIDNLATVPEPRKGNSGTTLGIDDEVASIWDMPCSPPKSKRVPSKRQSPDPPVDELDLEHAVVRRREWTPPRDSVAQTPGTESIGKENKHTPQDGTNSTFTHMVSNFTYESPTARPADTTAKPAPVNTGVTKRRRVELIDLPENQKNSRASSPDKGKAPKKKPRTITDLVTGQYAPKDPILDPDTVTSDFFGAQNSAAKPPTSEVATNPLPKPPRRRAKPKADTDKSEPKAKPRARKATTKAAAKPKPVAEKLLSPRSATLRLQQQDVLFGTSSQLALEESPTTVRQIQHAIKESEQDAESTFDTCMGPPLRWPKLGKVQGARGLWGASNRDEGGGLLEDMEDVYIPEPDRTQDIPLLMNAAPESPDPHSDFVDIDDIEPLPITISSDLPTPHPLSQPVPAEKPTIQQEATDEASFYDIDDFDRGPPPSNQNAESQESFFDIDDFDVPASAQGQGSTLKMSKTPPSATAKAQSRKGRSAPPTTYATPMKKTKPASAPIPESFGKTKTTSLPPTTPPRSTGRFIDIDEILDSEEEILELLSPTPPRVRKLQDSPPPPLPLHHGSTLDAHDEQGLTRVLRIPTVQLEWANIKSAVSASITAHIRSIAPTTDPKHPSWHEKILMYDPIILEDFTTYLNNNTRIRTYKRATQKQIKAWNKELKMKGNAILGVERDSEVLAIEKELEIFMVRDWCQEMSVCGIHAKESRGRGSARKGFY